MPTLNQDKAEVARQRRLAAKMERDAAAKLRAEQRKASKLHAIAERRAKQHRLTKTEFIAEIVSGKYPPITAADIEAEPDPVEPAQLTPTAVVD
jgi:hypothetical protein